MNLHIKLVCRWFSAWLRAHTIQHPQIQINHHKPHPPSGQAAVEYLLVAAALLLAWTALDRTSYGLAQAFLRMLFQYGFSLSIPW